MRKLFLPLCAVILTAFFLVSCHKSSSDTVTNSSYYLKCKIDGTAHNFNSNNAAHLMTFGGGASGASLGLIGTNSTTASEGIALQINFNSNAPAPGTYHEDDANADYSVGGEYNPGSASIIYGAGTTYPTALPLSITITSVDSKEISGTFKGAFYETNATTGTQSATKHVTITEGEFKLPVTQ